MWGASTAHTGTLSLLRFSGEMQGSGGAQEEEVIKAGKRQDWWQSGEESWWGWGWGWRRGGCSAAAHRSR